MSHTVQALVPITLIDKSWRCLQDLVIPAFKPPAHVASSPLLGGPVLERTHLLFFRGDVGLHRLPNYSRGIRWEADAHKVLQPVVALQLPDGDFSMAWHLRAARALLVLTSCISGAMCTSCIFGQSVSAHHASDSSPVHSAGRGFTTCPGSITGSTHMASPLQLVRKHPSEVTASGWHQANSAW